MNKQYFYQNKQHVSRITTLAVISILVIGGLLFSRYSKAATPFLSLEPENAVVSSGASIVSDSTASSGQAILFNAAATASSSALAVSVSANTLISANGKPLVLRGVNRSGTEYMCQGGSGGPFDGPSDAASIAVIKSWHVDVVRVPVNEQCWLGINGLPNAGYTAAVYQQSIETYITELHAQGIYAILDLHWVNSDTNKASGQTPMPDADHALDFWTSAATAFKDDPATIFDAFNEPYPDSNSDSAAAWSCWKNGGTCPGVSYSVAGMQQIVTAIRATGAKNPIMLGGIEYSNDLDQWLANKPTDPLNQLIAAWHSYNFNVCNTSTCWNNQVAPVAASVPVIIGEIGENDCSDSYVNNLMDWADTKNISYVAWAWNTYDCSSFPSLISNFDGTPTNFGVGIKNHIETVQ